MVAFYLAERHFFLVWRLAALRILPEVNFRRGFPHISLSILLLLFTQRIYVLHCDAVLKLLSLLFIWRLLVLS